MARAGAPVAPRQKRPECVATNYVLQGVSADFTDFSLKKCLDFFKKKVGVSAFD